MARHAQGLAEVVPDIDVVAVDGDMARWPEVPNVSRIVSRPGLPFYAQMLRGVGVDGGLGTAWIREAARVTARLGRVVVTDAPEDAGQILEAAGMSVLAQEPGTVVAARA